MDSTKISGKISFNRLSELYDVGDMNINSLFFKFRNKNVRILIEEIPEEKVKD